MSLLKPRLIASEPSNVRQLESLLDSNAAATLRQLLDVLTAPEDAPRLSSVLDVACTAVTRYGTTLSVPSTIFRVVQRNLDELREGVAAITEVMPLTTCQLDQPLMRRMTAHAPYALCLTLGALAGDDVGMYLEAAGVEIALGLATGLCFPAKFASAIRRRLTPELFGIKRAPEVQPPDWSRAYLKARVTAAKYFEAGGNPDSQMNDPVRLFDISAGFELSRKTRYAPPRQRQALLDRRHQSMWQMKASAASLMAQAELCDHTALLLLLAFSSGLTLRLTKEVPLAGCGDDDEWLMLLDLEAGVIKTNLDHLFPSAAMPRASARCFRPANRIVVKPLPAFLCLCLRELQGQCPGAKTLAQLLPGARTSGCQLTLAEDTSALAPSAKRFLITAAPVAVNLGIDRLTAALVANDFAVVPSSKLYYCLAQREEIWAASKALFDALGWGEPTPLQRGLPVGSRIVPTRTAVCSWWAWMVADVAAAAPGRHCSLERLVTFHNKYARLCASLAVFCLAAREVKVLRFTTHNLSHEMKFAAFVDKHVGVFPGAQKVPINRLLQRQLRLWRAHCEALHRRFNRIADPRLQGLPRMLERYLGGDCQALFFQIDGKTHRAIAIGSADLINWWPESFSADLGRHFWETELRDAGVCSSRIDVLLRHLTQGTEAHCSTNGDKLADVAAQITAVQVQLLESLGVQPIPGLVSSS